MAQDSRGSGSGFQKSPTHRGMEQLVARKVHILEVADSNSAPATHVFTFATVERDRAFQTEIVRRADDGLSDSPLYLTV